MKGALAVHIQVFQFIVVGLPICDIRILIGVGPVLHRMVQPGDELVRNPDKGPGGAVGPVNIKTQVAGLGGRLPGHLHRAVAAGGAEGKQLDGRGKAHGFHTQVLDEIAGAGGGVVLVVELGRDPIQITYDIGDAHLVNIAGHKPVAGGISSRANGYICKTFGNCANRLRVVDLYAIGVELQFTGACIPC